MVPLDINLIKDELYKGKDLSESQLKNSVPIIHSVIFFFVYIDEYNADVKFRNLGFCLVSAAKNRVSN